MSVVTYVPAAIADIDGIWDYSADNWGADQADRYTDLIRDLCADLADGKKRGRPVKAREGYFQHSVERHIVYFVHTTDGIAVIRVLHQKMDTEGHL